MQAVKVVESSAQRIVATENEDATIRRQSVGHVGPRRRTETNRGKPNKEWCICCFSYHYCCLFFLQLLVLQ